MSSADVGLGTKCYSLTWLAHTLAQRPHRHLFRFAEKLLPTKTSKISIIAQKVSVWASETSGFFITWLEPP